jgi:hypothetical protein
MRSCLVILWFISVAAQAAGWQPSDALLNAVRRIESADGLFTVGDNGRSLGNYQLSEGAWLDVNSWRKERGIPTFNYGQNVWSETVSRSYAADYLKILHSRLERRLPHAPSTFDVYAAYNRGFSSFARTGYRSSCLTANQRKQLQASRQVL